MSHEQKQADARQRTLARELEWVRMGARARQAKGKARLTAYEQLLAEANDARGPQARELEIAIPPGPRLGDQVIEVADLRKGYGDRLLIEDLTFSPAAVGDRRDHRPERRGQDDPLPDARRPGGARRRLDHRRRHGRDELRRPEPRRAGRRQDGLPGDHRTTSRRSRSGTARSRPAPMSRRSTSAARTSRSSSGSCPAASGTGSTSRSCSRRAATSCSSTSRRTTSTSTRCGRWRPASSRSRAASS